MSNNGNNLNRQYLEMKIQTASKGELVIMLYDGAMKFLNQGKVAIENKNYEQKDFLLDKVEAIIYELINGLDFERGGEIAKNLKPLYLFMVKHLFEARMNSNVQAIDEVYVMLSELREAWAKIIAKGSEGSESPARHNLNGTRLTRQVI